jgi:Tol biopolymer transport system component
MRPRALALTLAAILLAFVVWRERFTTAASSRDTVTWGANDPTWSPDGKRIAFALWGSIWAVEAKGGEAVQISSSGGYHAHPAWSPKGDWIAYIDGAVPAGPLPNISGRLYVVNASTGESACSARNIPRRALRHGRPMERRSLVALNVPDSGALLHVIDAATGAARPLQPRTQRGISGNWMATSWPVQDEIFYTGQRFNNVQNGSQRLGAPQIWSIPAAPRPIVVQLPLTSYRLADIAQIHSVSALPDGSGAIFSAVVVNGKGDRELYRVPRTGGKPVALTNTPRDEFSPAISPDGKTIAHVFESTRQRRPFSDARRGR